MVVRYRYGRKRRQRRGSREQSLLSSLVFGDMVSGKEHTRMVWGRGQVERSLLLGFPWERQVSINSLGLTNWNNFGKLCFSPKVKQNKKVTILKK